MFKKDCEPLMALLNDLIGKKFTQAHYDQLVELAKKGSVDKTFYTSESGKVFLKCYYFKKWFVLGDQIDWAEKKTPSGYNNMCRIGGNLWTQQYNKLKKAKEEILTKVAEGLVSPYEVTQLLQDAEEKRNYIDYDKMPTIGFDTLEEAIEYHGE